MMKYLSINYYYIFFLLGVNSFTVNAATICGPGTNWIVDCGQSTDVFSISIAFGLSDSALSQAQYTAIFEGQMVVKRGDAYSSGEVSDPGYLDKIDMEILSLTATGTSSEVAGWVMNAGTEFGRSTAGYIQDLTDSSGVLTGTTKANFDLDFEIINTAYGTLHRDPALIQNPYLFFDGIIEEWPGDISLNHTGCCFGTKYDLVGSDGNYAVSIVDQRGSDHLNIGRPEIIITGVVVPTPGSLLLMLSGLVGFSRFYFRRKK